MSDSFTVTLNAKDNLSPALQKAGAAADQFGAKVGASGTKASAGLKTVGASATAAGAGLNQAGAAGAKAGAGLDKAAASSSKLGAAFQKNKVSAAAFGAATTSLVGALSSAANAAAEEEAVFARLEAAVEATGASYEEFATQIDEAVAAGEELAFADDATAAALASLTATTGDAGQALDLMGVSMDLARGKGIDLATAAGIVGKVAAGNTGILSRYGIVLAEGATATEALAAIQGRYAGQAEAYGNSTQGAIDKVKNSTDNWVESIGASLGPMQTTLALLPGISAGFTLFGGAIGAVAPKIATASKAIAAFGIGLGPVGLGLAAVAAVAGLALYVKSLSDAETESEAAAAAVDSLTEALLRQQAAGLGISWGQKMVEEFSGATGVLGDLEANLVSVEDAAQASGETGVGAFLGIIPAVYDAGAAIDRYGLSVPQVEAAHESLNDILSYTGDNMDAVQRATEHAFQEFNAGRLSAAGLTKELALIAGNADILFTGMGPVATAVDEVAAAFTRSVAIAPEVVGSARSITVTYRAMQDAATAAAKAQREMDEAVAAMGGLHDYEGDREKVAAYTAEQEKLAAETLAATQAVAGFANTLRGSLGQAAVDATTGMVALDGSFQALGATLGLIGADALDIFAQMEGLGGNMEAGDQIAASAENAMVALSQMSTAGVQAGASVATSFIQVADGLNDAKVALDGVIAGFEHLDSIQQSVDAGGDIVSTMIGEPGVWEAGAQAIANNTLSVQELAEAQKYQAQFAKASFTTEAALNDVRIAQLPTLAKYTDAMAQQAVALSQLGPAEQAHAIAMQDAGIQASIAAAFSTAYAASLGQIPAEVATDIIANAAAADPVLAGVLESMHLIDVNDVTGDITVTMPDSSAAVLQKFEGMFGGQAVALDAFGLVHVTDAAGNEQVYTQFGQLVDKSVTATINVVYNLPTEGQAGALAGMGLGDSMGNPQEQAISIPVKPELDTSTFQADLATALAPLTSAAATPIEVKASISLTDNATSKVTDFKTAADGINGQTYTATLNVTNNALLPINEVQKGGDKFDGMAYTATLAVTNNALMPINEALKAGDKFDGQPYTAILNVTDNAKKTIDDVIGAGQNFGDDTYTAIFAADANPFSLTASDVTGAGQNFEDTTYTATLAGDPSEWATALSDALSGGQGWEDAIYTATLAGDGSGWDSAISAATSAGQGFAGTTYTAVLAADATSFWGTVGAIAGTTVGTAYLNVQGVYVPPANAPAMRHGGIVDEPKYATIPAAQHGRMMSPVRMNEGGGETVMLPNGSMILPHAASMAAAKSGGYGSGRGMTNYGTINVYPPNDDVYGAIRARMRGLG